jgi:hypothetical protein
MLTQEYIRSILHYNQITGQFTWLKTLSNRAKKGSFAGTINPRGYMVITIQRKRLFSHRLAWLYVYGVMPYEVIDHIDGDCANNAINNLRCVKQSQNTKNNKLSKNNTSGYPGVYFDKRASIWYAQIWSDFKCIHIGSFKEKECAISARKEAEKKYGYKTRLPA